MTTLRTSLSSLLGITLLVMVVLSSCAKEEIVEPASSVGIAKGLTVPTVTHGSANGASESGSRDDNDGGAISDDGDDVGDGERNKKKKPN